MSALPETKIKCKLIPLEGVVLLQKLPHTIKKTICKTPRHSFTIPCIWTIVVGTLVSFLTKPQDPKTLNPDLISPGFYQVFGGCWPKFINNYLIGLGIGSKWVKDEKYHTLVEQQIKTSGHVDHQETGQSNGMKNPGFEMSEKNIEVF